MRWFPEDYDGLVLPENLQKLKWESNCSVTLPLGLKELVVTKDAPLELPDGLLKITLGTLWSGRNQRHRNLPASVREVTCSGHVRYTHPATLQHLILYYTDCEIDLSKHKVHKLTIACRSVKMKEWPPELKELEFTENYLDYPLQVPTGCIIVGKRPTRGRELTQVVENNEQLNV